jgi:predicted metalloendopeptidase
MLKKNDKPTALQDSRELRAEVERITGNLVLEMARISAHMSQDTDEQKIAKVNLLDKTAKYLYPQVKATELNTGNVDSIADILNASFVEYKKNKKKLNEQ